MCPPDFHALTTYPWNSDPLDLYRTWFIASQRFRQGRENATRRYRKLHLMNDEICSIRKMLYSTCTAAARKGLYFRNACTYPHLRFMLFFRSRTVDNDRNRRIAVPRWRYGKLLYVSTYTVDRSSILFDSCFFVSRHIIQFSLKRCENDKTTKAINERLSNQGHGHVDCRWKCPRQALLIVFLVSKMVGNFSQKFPDFAGGSLLVCRSASLHLLKQIMCLRSIFFSGLAQGLQAQPSSQMLKCEDKRLSWRSLTNTVIMIQPSTPPRTLVDPLVTFIDVFHILGRGR